MQYITTNMNGEIIAMADFEFPDSVKAEKIVVRGWDGVLYYEGDSRIEQPESNILMARKSSVRAVRDKNIESTQWIIQRHLDEISVGLDTTLTPESYQKWLQYRQYLRDIPTQPGFPWGGGGVDDAACPWPAKP